MGAYEAPKFFAENAAGATTGPGTETVPGTPTDMTVCLTDGAATWAAGAICGGLFARGMFAGQYYK